MMAWPSAYQASYKYLVYGILLLVNLVAVITSAWVCIDTTQGILAMNATEVCEHGN